MDCVNEAVGAILNRLAEQSSPAPEDYTECGVLHCGVCREPKQALIDWPAADGGTAQRLVPVTCRCRREEEARLEQEDRKLQFDAYMRQQIDKYGISDWSFRKNTFRADDQPDDPTSRVCREYVARWPEMRADGMGILFYGTVGTGKSFYAGCIVNALLERQVPAAMTNFPRLLNILQGSWGRQQVIDHLQEYRLLVIDDLGVERDSQYAAEQVYNVIDARARCGLPLIVTTNLTIDEMRNPGNMQYKRIYDRVIEMCPITLRMTGESRRASDAEARKEKAREILRGAVKGKENEK